MTGYESKRAAAQDKLDDDDALTIAYQSGYYDGKKAAQPAQDRTDYAVHLNHCNIGECQGVCKYLDDDCPALKHADMKAKWDSPATQQPAQEPPQYSFKAYLAEDGRIGVVACIIRPDGGPHIMSKFIDPPQPAQEPVAYLCRLDEHGLFDIPTPDKACKDCFPVYAAPPKPAQEPVACVGTNGELMWLNKPRVIYSKPIPLYTAPAQRPWVGLTDDEPMRMWDGIIKYAPSEMRIKDFAQAIEATLRSKNT